VAAPESSPARSALSCHPPRNGYGSCSGVAALERLSLVPQSGSGVTVAPLSPALLLLV